MKLAIATIYWNSRQGLKRLLKSIPPNTLDYFIAIDGMFAFYSAQNYKRYNFDLSDPSHVPNYNSLDGSTELLQSHFKDTNTKLILEQSAQPMTQVQKRNRYLEICDKQQVDITHLIIVDSDEFFHYPKDAQNNQAKQQEYWTQFKSNFTRLTTLDPDHHNVYSIKCIYADQKPAIVMDRPRCWYNPGQMRYIRNSHYHYANIYTEQAKINYTPSYSKTRMYCQPPKYTLPDTVMLVHDPNILSTKQQKLRQLYKKYSHIYEQQILTGKTHKEADLIARKGTRLNQ